MRAFENVTMTKPEMLSALKWHQEADNFMRGRYWEDGKGCAVGCSLESVARLKNIKLKDFSDHAQYEPHLGIPWWLARIQDVIFEDVSEARSKTWPLEFIEAIPEGADLSQVFHPFMIVVLKSTLKNFDHSKNPQVVKVINEIIALHERGEPGHIVLISDSESAAESAAWSAAESAARSAAWSAARSAARSAAWSAARSAAWSAAESAAWSAAWSATMEYFADELLKLLRNCK